LSEAKENEGHPSTHNRERHERGGRKTAMTKRECVKKKNGKRCLWRGGGLAGVGAAGNATLVRSQAPEEIVVTSRNRQESGQDARLTVSAISQGRIDRFDITSLEKLAALPPQFFVGRGASGSGAQMTMRGIGSSSTSIGVEQSVAV